jgi:hypothetical protein
LSTGDFSLGIPFRNLEYVDFIFEKLLEKNTQMTREEFIRELDFYGYSYVIEEESILVGGGMVRGEKDHIWLTDIEELPSGVVFINEGNLWLSSLRRIPSGVSFANGGNIHLSNLVRGKLFHRWDGHISGIDSTLLLNKMISIGLFDR